MVFKSFLTFIARKNCFYSTVWETETFFGIVIFWVGGKNCIVKNGKFIVFPESRYVNSNPGMVINKTRMWKCHKILQTSEAVARDLFYIKVVRKKFV